MLKGWLRPGAGDGAIDFSQVFDVLVIGGGNAGLCSALTAQEAGCKFLLLESAPKDFRGGNSRHTRNIRYVNERGNDHLTGPYEEGEFWNDLMAVTGKVENHSPRRSIDLIWILSLLTCGIKSEVYGEKFTWPE